MLPLPAIPTQAAIVFALSVLLFATAYLSARAGRVAVALAFVLMAGAGIRIYDSSDRHLHEWDERFHAVVAKHLIEHPLTPTLYDDPVLPFEYRDWMSNHIWLHKPPLALWLMAASLSLFGMSEFSLRLPSVILSALAIALTFAIGRRLFDTRVGLLAAGFHAVNGMLVALSGGSASADHVDTLLIVLFELGVFIAVLDTEADRVSTRVALGLILGLSVLTKWYPALLMLPVWAYLSLLNTPPPRFAPLRVDRHFRGDSDGPSVGVVHRARVSARGIVGVALRPHAFNRGIGGACQWTVVLHCRNA